MICPTQPPIIESCVGEGYGSLRELVGPAHFSGPVHALGMPYGAVVVNVVVPETPPNVAVTIEVPTAAPVASPPLAIVAGALGRTRDWTADTACCTVL